MMAKIQILLDSYLFDIPLEFGGLKCNGQPTNFLLPFSSLGSLLFSYLVPTYIRYLRQKTVVRNENLVGGAGDDFIRYDKFSCTATILPLASATTHRRQNIRKIGTKL